MNGNEITFETLQSLQRQTTVYRVGFLAYDGFENSNEFTGDELEALFLSEEHAMEYAESITRDMLVEYLSGLGDEKVGIRVQLEIINWHGGEYDYIDILTVNEFPKKD